MNKNLSIGIIAEDESDVTTARVLICRIVGHEKCGVSKFIGHGCGKIKRKCNSWANTLKNKGCLVLIIIHDLDRNNLDKLKTEIKSSLSPSPITKHLICIPIQEIEAWLLSDPEGLKKGMRLKKMPKIKGDTELIESPKEYLGKIIDRASDQERIYIHTKHNEIIARFISIDIMKKKCRSFVPFYKFIKEHLSV